MWKQWKQFPNVIMAVTLPRLPLCFSHSIATLNWSSRLSLGGSRAVSTAGRRRPAPFRPATPVTTSQCARGSCALPQVGQIWDSLLSLWPNRNSLLLGCCCPPTPLRSLHSQNAAVQRRGRLRRHVRRSWLQEGVQTLQVRSRGVLGNRKPGQRVSPRCAEGCRRPQMCSLPVVCVLESTSWTVTWRGWCWTIATTLAAACRTISRMSDSGSLITCNSTSCR